MSLQFQIISSLLIATMSLQANAKDTELSTPAMDLTPGFTAEAPKVYTSGNQEDYSKEPSPEAAKGATVLVWAKNSDLPRGQVEIYRKGQPEKALRFLTEANLFHTMVYFGKDYEWRVRYMTADDQPASEFSEAVGFQVLRKGARPQTTQSIVSVESGAAIADEVKPAPPFESDGTPIARSSRVKKRQVANAKTTSDLSKLPPRLRQPDPFVVMQAPTRDPQSAKSKRGKIENEEPLFEDSPDDSDSADFSY